MASWWKKTGGVDVRHPSSSCWTPGIFDTNAYFDVYVEYAKASPNDVLIEITVAHRGTEPAPLHLLPISYTESEQHSAGDRRRLAIPSCQRLERIEYVHGEHGRGLGASHQIGWTALVTRCLEDLAKTALLS